MNSLEVKTIGCVVASTAVDVRLVVLEYPWWVIFLGGIYSLVFFFIYLALWFHYFGDDGEK